MEREVRDWTGDAGSVFKALGATSHSPVPRQPHDYYATDPSALASLAAKFTLPHAIWEPACGEGHLAQWLVDRGHRVYASDIIDRGYGIVADFLATESMPGGCHCILTNPPYRIALPFTLHALRLLPTGGWLVLLLKTTFLEGIERHERLFSTYPPRHVFQFVRRTLCARNGDFAAARRQGSAVSYAWFAWQKGYKGKPEVTWI